MIGFLKRLLLLLGTLGLGALAYSLLRTEGELGAPAEAAGPGAAGPEPEPRPEPEPAGAPPTVAPARCAATTKSGKRCGREAQPGSRYCWQHGG